MHYHCPSKHWINRHNMFVSKNIALTERQWEVYLDVPAEAAARMGFAAAAVGGCGRIWDEHAPKLPIKGEIATAWLQSHLHNQRTYEWVPQNLYFVSTSSANPQVDHIDQWLNVRETTLWCCRTRQVPWLEYGQLSLHKHTKAVGLYSI